MYGYIHICAVSYIYIHIYMYVYICIYMCIYIYMYIRCVFAYLYLYIPGLCTSPFSCTLKSDRSFKDGQDHPAEAAWESSTQRVFDGFSVELDKAREEEPSAWAGDHGTLPDGLRMAYTPQGSKSMYVHMYLYLYVYMYMYMDICICIYIDM